MRIAFLFFFALCFAPFTHAQTKAETFAKIQKLLNKAEGKKILSILGNSEKIGDQKFREDFISVEKIGQGKYSSTWLYDYSNLNWEAGFRYNLWPVTGNEKLKMLRFSFEESVDYVMHVKGKDGEKSKSSSIELYFLAKDYDQMESLMKQATGK